MVMAYAGIVLGSIALICAQISVPATAGERLVVSESGDILSPKNAPEQIAPTVQCIGTPSASPMPTMARPTVPTVPQEVPVASETTVVKIQVAGRNTVGFKIDSPYTSTVCTVPAAMEAAIIMPTQRIITVVGSATFITRYICCSMPAHLRPLSAINMPVIQMPMTSGTCGV